MVTRTILVAALLAAVSHGQQAVAPNQPVPFRLLSVTPAQNARNVARTTTIELQFSHPVDLSTMVPPNFHVMGRFSGPKVGMLLTATASGRTVRFTPARAFSAGETVYLVLGRNVRDANGKVLGRGYACSFTVDSRSSSSAFPLQRTLAPGLTPYGAHGGDLNDDGMLDLAIPNEDSADVSVFLNLGGWSFTPEASYAVGFHCSPSEGADLDFDGDVDLVVANILADDVSVLMGRGDGTFEPQVRHATGREPRGLALLDVDGDGDLDVVSANRRGAGSLSLLVNQGNGQLAPEVRLQANMSGETGVAACDLDNDFVFDLVVIGYASDQIASLLGDGRGGFTVHQVAAVGSQPWMVTWGDVDGDGFNDAGAALSGEDRVGVVRNDGSGSFGASTKYAVGSFPIAIDFGDLDADGDLDLAASNFGSADYTFYLNTGGAFGGKFSLPAVSAGSCTVLHDLDGDGDVDITAIDEIADIVLLYRHDG